MTRGRSSSDSSTGDKGDSPAVSAGAEDAPVAAKFADDAPPPALLPDLPPSSDPADQVDPAEARTGQPDPDQVDDDADEGLRPIPGQAPVVEDTGPPDFTGVPALLITSSQNVTLGEVFVAVGETKKVPAGIDTTNALNAGIIEIARGKGRT